MRKSEEDIPPTVWKGWLAQGVLYQQLEGAGGRWLSWDSL